MFFDIHLILHESLPFFQLHLSVVNDSKKRTSAHNQHKKIKQENHLHDAHVAGYQDSNVHLLLEKGHLDLLLHNYHAHGYEIRVDQRVAHHSLRVDNLVDRKSTRLNSSHVSISYAVVCLKK